MERINEILKALPSSRIEKTDTPKPLSTQNSKTVEELEKSLNIKRQHTFENLESVAGLSPVISAIKGVLKGPRFMVLIYGGTGNGKTHLLESAAIELYKRGEFARVVSFAQVLNNLKKSMNTQGWNYQERLDHLCDCERLIIDDIGAAGSNTEFGMTILETIVCARYNNHLLTLMTTNLDIAQLPDRVISRLQDKTTSYLVQNKAKDYRPKL